MTLNDDLVMARSRADSYSLLSRCFFAPDKDLLVTLRTVEATEENVWRELIENTPGLEEIGMLSVDYARLFVGPFKLLAPPYGSVYLDSGGLVAGDSTARIQKLYRQEGVDVNLKEIPDHIGVEFAFMHRLITKEISSIDVGDTEEISSYRNKQFSFLKEFLCPWITQFSGAIREHSGTGFYRSLGKIAETFVMNDVAVLEQELGQ